MTKRIFLILMLLLELAVSAQKNSRNGCYCVPFGDIRFLVVFADVIDDPFDGAIQNWPEGELPSYANEVIDDSIA